MLKESESIKFELIVGEPLYLDKKSFKWSISEYTSDRISFKFTFEHPEYISSGTTDSMMLTIANTDVWMKPTDSYYDELPDGYSVIIPLPP